MTFMVRNIKVMEMIKANNQIPVEFIMSSRFLVAPAFDRYEILGARLSCGISTQNNNRASNKTALDSCNFFGLR